MSWISDNYEKAAIGGAAVVALGCAAIVFSGKGAIDEAVELSKKYGDTKTASYINAVLDRIRKEFNVNA